MINPAKLFWLGFFLVAGGWQFLVPILGPRHPWLGGLLVTTGALLNGVSLLKAQPPRIGGSLLAYAAAGFLVSLLAPFPYCLGGFIVLGGVAIAVFSRGRIAGVGFGMLYTGVAVITIGACAPLVLSIVCGWHTLAFLGPVVALVFRLFGYSAHFDTGAVFVQGPNAVQEYVMVNEYFGWMFLFPAVLGVLIWHLLVPAKSWWNFLLFLVALLVFAFARYLLLALLYLDLPFFPMFWNPWVLCLTFLPLFLLFLIGPSPTTASAGSTAGRPQAESLKWPLNAEQVHHGTGWLRAPTAVVLSTAAAVACLVAAWGWEDPGRLKPGRMFIDEGHSAWEKTDRAYDTEWYGEESGYNYYCLAQFLGYYYQLRHNSEKITDALLADCDILLIRTPTSAFTADEISAIERFVRRGGGLLLIGDHTNVFGTGTYLNAIARRFGLHYNYDATYDLPTGGLSFFEHPKLLPHPIVQHMPPFLFGTSCTLDVSPMTAIPIQGYALRVAGHDYSATSFFTHKTDGPHVGFGVFPQLAAVKYGRGRVAAFTDSTVFSNFWMFLPGKPELFLGCTEWLNRQNRYAQAPLALCAAGLILILVTAFPLRRAFIDALPAVLASACAGFFAGAYLTRAANDSAYSPPAPHTPYPTICFDRQFSHFELPADSLMHPPNEDFHTFYTWAQRVSRVPQVSPNLRQALAGATGVVMLNPSGVIPSSVTEELKQYVRGGGVLYVFNSATNTAVTANQILRTFGLALTNCPSRQQAILNASDELVASNRLARLTVGGQGLLFTSDHLAILSVQREGKGAVIFSGAADLFANSSMGLTGTVPDAAQRRLYKVVFDLFQANKSVIGLPSPSRVTKNGRRSISYDSLGEIPNAW